MRIVHNKLHFEFNLDFEKKDHPHTLALLKEILSGKEFIEKLGIISGLVPQRELLKKREIDIRIGTQYSGEYSDGAILLSASNEETFKKLEEDLANPSSKLAYTFAQKNFKRRKDELCETLAHEFIHFFFLEVNTRFSRYMQKGMRWFGLVTKILNKLESGDELKSLTRNDVLFVYKRLIMQIFIFSIINEGLVEFILDKRELEQTLKQFEKELISFNAEAYNGAGETVSEFSKNLIETEVNLTDYWQGLGARFISNFEMRRLAVLFFTILMYETELDEILTAPASKMVRSYEKSFNKLKRKGYQVGPKPLLGYKDAFVNLAEFNKELLDRYQPNTKRIAEFLNNKKELTEL